MCIIYISRTGFKVSYQIYKNAYNILQRHKRGIHNLHSTLQIPRTLYKTTTNSMSDLRKWNIKSDHSAKLFFRFQELSWQPSTKCTWRSQSTPLYGDANLLLLHCTRELGYVYEGTRLCRVREPGIDSQYSEVMTMIVRNFGKLGWPDERFLVSVSLTKIPSWRKFALIHCGRDPPYVGFAGPNRDPT